MPQELPDFSFVIVLSQVSVLPNIFSQETNKFYFAFLMKPVVLNKKISVFTHFCYSPAHFNCVTKIVKEHREIPGGNKPVDWICLILCLIE